MPKNELRDPFDPNAPKSPERKEVDPDDPFKPEGEPEMSEEERAAKEALEKDRLAHEEAMAKEAAKAGVEDAKFKAQLESDKAQQKPDAESKSMTVKEVVKTAVGATVGGGLVGYFGLSSVGKWFRSTKVYKYLKKTIDPENWSGAPTEKDDAATEKKKK